jgi:polyisoprenoid-binding protein YceI
MTLRSKRTLSVLAGLAMAATPLPGPITMAPESKLWVEGTSTVRDWKCQAPVLESTIAGSDKAIHEVLEGERGISAVTLTVPVEKMNCNDNGTMNEHMKKALKLTEFPVITFKLDSYDLKKATAGVQATLTGTLMLGGVEKPMTFPVDVADAGGKLHVTGSAIVHMKDHNLKPPTLMLGTMRVGNDVTVKFDLLLNP